MHIFKKSSLGASPAMEFAKFIPESRDRKLVGRLDLEIFEGGAAVKNFWLRSFKADPFFRLYLVLEGEVGLRFPGGVHLLRPGHLHLIPANVPFRYEPKSPLRHYWLHFCSSLLEKLPHFRCPIDVPAEDIPDAEKVMERLLHLFDDSGKTGAVMRMDIILRQLLTPFFERIPDDANEDSLEHMDEFAQVVDYIDRRIDQDIVIQELADLVRMKPRNFSTFFRRAFGVPPKQYLTRRRVDRAKMLLIRTRLLIKEIAVKVGYGDNELYFYRIFRRLSGMSPNEYRQANNPCQ